MSPIANMLIQIKNAQSIGREDISIPFSAMKMRIAEILKENGYLENVENKKKKGRKAELPYLNLRLKYIDGRGTIKGIKLISKPSRRVYASKADLKPVKSGIGLSVVSTPRGVMAGKEAKKHGIGGEILFEIW